MKPVMQPYTASKHKAVTAIRSLAIRKSAKLFNAKGENEDGEDFDEFGKSWMILMKMKQMGKIHKLSA